MPARRHVRAAEVERHRHARPAARRSPSPSWRVRPVSKPGRPGSGCSCSTVWPWKPIRSMSLQPRPCACAERRRPPRSARRPPPRPRRRSCWARARRAPSAGLRRWRRAPARAGSSGRGASPAGPKAETVSPSVSITAMSMASSEVPLMKPSTRMGQSPISASSGRAPARPAGVLTAPDHVSSSAEVRAASQPPRARSNAPALPAQQGEEPQARGPVVGHRRPDGHNHAEQPAEQPHRLTAYIASTTATAPSQAGAAHRSAELLATIPPCYLHAR